MFLNTACKVLHGLALAISAASVLTRPLLTLHSSHTHYIRPHGLAHCYTCALAGTLYAYLPSFAFGLTNANSPGSLESHCTVPGSGRWGVPILPPPPALMVAQTRGTSQIHSPRMPLTTRKF